MKPHLNQTPPKKRNVTSPLYKVTDLNGNHIITGKSTEIAKHFSIGIRAVSQSVKNGYRLLRKYNIELVSVRKERKQRTLFEPRKELIINNQGYVVENTYNMEGNLSRTFAYGHKSEFIHLLNQ